MTQFDPAKPYNQLPQLPPSADIESKAILKKCVTARAALAALKQAGGLIPNQAVLINTIPLLEARDSSEIENIVTTTDKLFQYAEQQENQADPATKEALRYRTALYQGYRALKDRPLCTATAVEVCTTIKGVDMNIRRVPGTTLANDATGETIYTPPEGEALLRELMANWEQFVHNHPQIEPLVRMAVTHYQFEAIHPFTDGNGRTGRVLNLLFLIEQDLLDTPILYLSRYIIQHKAGYYQCLLDVTTKQQWEQWILYILDAAEETANWTREKIIAIRDLMDHTTDFVRYKVPSIYSRELVEQTFMQPYCRIANLVDANIAKRQTASTYLKQLCGIGVLKEVKVGREKLFSHPKLMRLLTQDNNGFEQYR
ncbi:MAG: Fic family protein [Gammaproteobacteria bacterium]|nr:Fic family protein [Gammaproteobacteria bacterium]MCW8972592.1 Fic family protein [Gammaproteobacteria bacterium]MCW8992566.1 Fic family protein [Gammaproteobacteria bacterium]